MTCEDPGLFAFLSALGTSCSPLARHAGHAEHAGRLACGRPGSPRPADAGAWSEPTWRARAAERIASAPGCVALLLVDTSQPESEPAVLRCLHGIVRPADPVGRYATSQVAALVQVDLSAVGVLLAQRVRARLDRAAVGCAVGLAVSAGEGLGELLIRAGSDLMSRRGPEGIAVR